MVKRHLSTFASLAWNILLVMLLFTLCRLTFFALNKGLYPEVGAPELLRMCLGGLRFDISAILYTNSVLVLLWLLPLPVREKEWYRKTLKILFVAANFICLAANLGDSVYFPYVSHRTTMGVFQEFQGDGQVFKILLSETVSHWYLLLEGLLMLAALIWLYAEPGKDKAGWVAADYILSLAIIAAVLYPFVGGLRGGFGITTRPIAPNDANLYTDKPLQTGIVLNTPFCMYRTIGEQPYPEFNFLEDPSAIFPTRKHYASEGMRKKNVVILILESFSASYSEYLTGLQGHPQPGYMPFLDSLMKESLIFRHSYANGRISIDALPSVMCCIPAITEPFSLSLYSQNMISGMAAELGREGYSSAFYHGANRSSLALAGFAHRCGFQREYSREDYADETDFDGTWGIWDAPFLQYFREGISNLPEPFLATVFTLSSHNPFALPEGVSYPEGSLPMHRVIRYSDDALRAFFREARKEPWFNNTLFVITGDHTGVTDVDEYKTDNGRYLIPILFYTPDGSLKGLREGTAQQLDIKPTVYGYLGYDKPFMSMGVNLLETPDEETCAFYYNGLYEFVSNGYLLTFNGSGFSGLYHYTTDPFLNENLISVETEVAEEMEIRFKARLQQLNSRMINNQLTED